MATKTNWELEFVKCKVPEIIPRDLIEGVKGRTYTPDQFYDYQRRNRENGFNYLFALIDSAKKIHGFLWAEQNSLDRSLFINTFSVAKPHWGKGLAIPHVIEFLDGFSRKMAAPRTYWCTTNEKFFIKHGFRRSKIVLMEYVDKIDYTKPQQAEGTDGSEQGLRASRDDDQAAAIAA